MSQHLHPQLSGYQQDPYLPFYQTANHYQQHPSASQLPMYGNFIYPSQFILQQQLAAADMANIGQETQLLLPMQAEPTEQTHYQYYPQYQNHQPQHHSHHHHAQHPANVGGQHPAQAAYVYHPAPAEVYAGAGHGNMPGAYLQQQQQQQQQHHQISVATAMANHIDAPGAGNVGLVDPMLLLESQPHMLHQQSQAQAQQQQQSTATTSVPKPGTAAATAAAAAAEMQQQQQQRRVPKQHNTNQALEHISKLMLKLDTDESQMSPTDRRDRILMYTHIALTIPVVWNYVCQLSEMKDEADPAKVYGFLYHLSQNNVTADEWEKAIRDQSVIFKVEEDRLRKKMCPILRIQGRNPDKIVTLCNDIKQKPSERYHVQDEHQLAQLKEFFFNFLPKELAQLNLKAPEQLVVDFASVLVIYSDSDSFDRMNSLLPQLAFTKLCLGSEGPAEPLAASATAADDPVEAAKRRWETQLKPCQCSRLSLYAVPGKWQSYPLVSDAQWELNQTESGTIMSTTFNIKPVKPLAVGANQQQPPVPQQQQQHTLIQEASVIKEAPPSVANTASLEPLVIEPVHAQQQQQQQSHSATAAAAAAAEHYTGSPILAPQEAPSLPPSASIYSLRETGGNFPTPPPPPPPPVPQPLSAAPLPQQAQISHHQQQQQIQHQPAQPPQRMYSKPPPPMHQHPNQHQHHHQSVQQAPSPAPFGQVTGPVPLASGPPLPLPPPTPAQSQHPLPIPLSPTFTGVIFVLSRNSARIVWQKKKEKI